VTQLAREFGAYVTALDAPRGASRRSTSAANESVDLDNEVLEDVGEVDLVFDLIGGDIGKQSARLVRAGGTLASIVGPSEARPANGLAGAAESASKALAPPRRFRLVRSVSVWL
jgi:NADPH:quinone reductase-like Zn-dependent oxidoreductase